MSSHTAFFYGKLISSILVSISPTDFRLGTLVRGLDQCSWFTIVVPILIPLQMAPQVLYRVCYSRPNPEPWQNSLLTIKPAVLRDFSRHKVRGCDYPGIIPTPPLASASASANSASPPAKAVRGTLVSGLTDGDLWRLDRFEGSEYERREVKVRPLTVVGDDAGEGNIEEEEVKAETYVWIAAEARLEDGEWDFGTFVREKLQWWAGAGFGEGEYAGESNSFSSYP